MYHVVVGVDDEVEHALRCVEEVVNLPGGTAETSVTLIHTFVDNPNGASATQVQSVREAADYLEEHGVEYEVTESTGDPADAIVSAADREEANLIVIGGRKRSPAGKALFGSVTQSIVLGAERPVMVTGVE